MGLHSQYRNPIEWGESVCKCVICCRLVVQDDACFITGSGLCTCLKCYLEAIEDRLGLIEKDFRSAIVEVLRDAERIPSNV